MTAQEVRQIYDTLSNLVERFGAVEVMAGAIVATYCTLVACDPGYATLIGKIFDLEPRDVEQLRADARAGIFREYEENPFFRPPRRDR
jgi:hypothetical protein